MFIFGEHFPPWGRDKAVLHCSCLAVPSAPHSETNSDATSDQFLFQRWNSSLWLCWAMKTSPPTSNSEKKSWGNPYSFPIEKLPYCKMSCVCCWARSASPWTQRQLSRWLKQDNFCTMSRQYLIATFISFVFIHMTLPKIAWIMAKCPLQNQNQYVCKNPNSVPL